MFPYHRLVQAVPALMLAWSAWNLGTQIRLSYRGVHTTGTVVRIEEDRDSDGVAYSPIVEYDVGRVHYTHHESGSSECDHAVGDTVSIIYDPDDPAHGRVDTFEHRWVFPLFIAGMGVVAAFQLRNIKPAARLPEARIES